VTVPARGRRARAAASVTIALAAVAGRMAFALTVLAASPTPDSGAGDPRSSGQGPGLVGDPLFALLAVVLIGLGSVVATLIWVRMTARPDA
jgi:hypothetical protein